MRTMRLLLCAACLCSAGVFVKSAMTQEKTSSQEVDEFEKVPDDAFDNGGGTEPLRTRVVDDDGNVNIMESYESSPLSGARRADLDEDDYLPGGPGTMGLGTAIGGGMQPGMGYQQPPMRPRTVRHTVTRTLMEPIPPEELKAMEKLQAAIQQLKTGKDDAARKAATETIQQQLTTQFEADLKQREKELAEVEQRVKSLREQLDKRKAAQADIINLRLQTLINDANGLGFPDTGFASGEPTVQDRAWAPVYPPVRTDETNAPLYDPGQKDSPVFQRDPVPELLQPVIPQSRQPLE